MKKPTSKAKGKIHGKDKFTATEVGTLVDQLRSEFKVFGENQESIVKKLDATYEQIARNTEDIALLKIAIKDTVTKAELKNMANKIEALINSIDRLIKTKADREEYQALEKRTSIVETGLEALSK